SAAGPGGAALRRDGGHAPVRGPDRGVRGGAAPDRGHGRAGGRGVARGAGGRSPGGAARAGGGAQRGGRPGAGGGPDNVVRKDRARGFEQRGRRRVDGPPVPARGATGGRGGGEPPPVPGQL